MTYDFRDRQITKQGPVDYFEMTYYDNLDRVIKSERNNTTGAGKLIGRRQINFDNRSRVYQTIVYAVDPTTGIVGNSLIDNKWFDASGNVIKSFPAGSSLFTKTTYDSLGRSVIRYISYGPDATYADASSVANNTVMEQAEMTYDADSNAILLVKRKRYHNAPASQTGALQNPGMTPNARVTYVAQYPDAISRPANIANYGTNGGTALVRPTTAPVRSDSILVNSIAYDSAGMKLQTTDPAGLVVRYVYDAVGRKVTVTENYIASSSSSSSSSAGSCTASDDTNRMTLYTYTPDGLDATMVAVNSRTTNQTTTYTYGTTLVESNVATSTLLRYVDYPDSTGGNDRVALTWNRQGQKTTLTDQRGCVHSYVYDLLGRLTNDCVTTTGTGVDATVLQLAAKYEVRGLVSELTTYSSSTPGAGTIVNDVVLAYNSFGQLVSDSQSHSGAVVPGTTPLVQYAYENGSSNMIRPTTLTYPNNRAITISYGTAGGINNSSSQIDNLSDSSGTLVNYAYLGLGTPVQTTYPLINTQYTLLGSSSGNSPAGDIYWGLDLFDRIIDSRWYNTSSSADVDRIKYGYDRASNRIWRQNPVATAAGANFDEFYTNDGLQRLKDMQRGKLNGTNTGLSTKTFEQCWTLDPTGNWRGFNEAAAGGSWTTVQTRSANSVNEITSIINTVGSPWATPAYDSAGNMTSIPQPSNMSANYTATYDAWNRLVKLVDATTGNTVQQNQYDARTFRTVIQSYTGGILSETRHSYSTRQWQSIEERVGSATTPDRQFVWGVRYIDDLVRRDRGTETLYAMQDANWNVSSIADGTGTIQERYSYSAYGNPTFLTAAFGSRSASSYTWETLYCGYRIDTIIAEYMVRHRRLHAGLGVWVSRDPLGYTPRSTLYEYVASSPLRNSDPLGLEPDSIARQRTLLIKDLETLCYDCCEQSAFWIARCKANAKEIGDAVFNRIHDTYWNWVIPRLWGGEDDRIGGYLCWDWAWSHLDAFNSAVGGEITGDKHLVNTGGSPIGDADQFGSDGEFFSARFKGSIHDTSRKKRHAWIEITVNRDKCPNAPNAVQIDDGFVGEREGLWVHLNNPPLPIDYSMDFTLPEITPITSCQINLDFNPQRDRDREIGEFMYLHHH